MNMSADLYASACRDGKVVKHYLCDAHFVLSCF